MLEALGHVVMGADSPATAMTHLGGVVFDVMIISLNEDDPDGNEIASKGKLLYPGLKVIVVSGWDIVPKLSSKVDAFVTKPFRLQQINMAICQVMEATGEVSSGP